MKTEKNKKLMIDNLTFYRLQADLYAVEADLADNRPTETAPTQNFLQKMIQKLHNEIKRTTTRDLTADKKAVLDELARFERAHKSQDLKLSQSAEKLKAFAQKKLFKKDPYELKKMQFALAFATENEYRYQRPEESLAAVSELLFDDPTYIGVLLARWQDNFVYVHRQELTDAEKSVLLISELVSPLLAIGGGIATIVKRKRAEKQLKEAFQTHEVSVNSIIALQLTLLEETRSTMPEKQRKNMLDAFLRTVNDYRADAEYGWLVEQLDAPACRQKIDVCNRAIERLSQIVGI